MDDTTQEQPNAADTTLQLLDLPTDLLAKEVLRHVQWSARATCSLFRRHLGDHLEELRLRWPDWSCTVAEQAAQLQSLLQCMPRLRVLDSSTCPADIITSLVAPLPLDTLTLDYCFVAANTLAPLAPASLRVLHVVGCHKPVHIRPLAACTALTSLTLRCIYKLVDASPLAACGASLSSLSLSGCFELTSISFLASCTTLHTLSIDRGHGLSNINPLSHCAALQTLYLSNCGNWDDLTPLIRCTQLKGLFLTNCWDLQELQPLAACATLASLACIGRHDVLDLRPLSQCYALTYLDLSNRTRYPSFNSLEPLIQCPALRALDLSNNSWLTDLRPLAACTQLEHLIVTNCRKVPDDAVHALCRPGLHISRFATADSNGSTNRDACSGTLGSDMSWNSEDHSSVDGDCYPNSDLNPTEEDDNSSLVSAASSGSICISSDGIEGSTSLGLKSMMEGLCMGGQV